ncbi:MATE family efflux transporter [Marinibaculum pumilum]|uniref:MATE family efflux transporter n=1 Tax=Marinibaculum pumilum TaxID=1766165 RepID=A0ABV7L489_9PROT
MRPRDTLWHRRVLALAWPVMIGNMTEPLLGAVDSAVVGHLEAPQYLAAVSVGTTIFSFVFFSFNFLRMGTTGLTAQAFGARDDALVKAIFLRAAAIGLALGILVIALQWPIRWLGLAVYDPGTEVAVLADSYLAIRLWGAPGALLNFCVIGWFIGRQDTRTPLLLQVLINVGNIALDLLFVVVLDWSVAGVALASALSVSFGALLGVALVWRAARRRHGRQPAAPVFDLPAMRRLVVLNSDIFLRTLCILVAIGFLVQQGALLGEVVLAANAIMLNMFIFLAFGLDGFAFAAEALVGRAIGRRRRRDVRHAILVSSLWAGAAALAYVLVYLALGAQIVGALTSLPEVKAEALDVLFWMQLMPLLGVWSFQLDGIFVGAALTREMRNWMLAALAAYFATWALLPTEMGNDRLWAAVSVFLVARALPLALLLGRVLDCAGPASGRLPQSDEAAVSRADRAV